MHPGVFISLEYPLFIYLLENQLDPGRLRLLEITEGRLAKELEDLGSCHGSLINFL